MNKRHNSASVWPLGLVVLVFISTIQAVLATPNLTTASKTQLVETYGKIPLSFEPNQGQTDKQVQFLSRGSWYSLFLTHTEVILSLHKPAAKGQKQPPLPQVGKASDRHITPSTALRMQLVGANPKPQVSGVNVLPGKVNYFYGNDPKQWRTNIPTYAKVKYEEVYPSIDLVYYGNQRQLEHDFVVAPGADPRNIRLAVSGADKLHIDAQGNLVMYTAGGEVRLYKPTVYQEIFGKRREINGSYVLHHGKDNAKVQVGFWVAAYDKSLPLIIDPVLSYSTFLGGGDIDAATSIAIDSAGNAYVTGQTLSTNFPTTAGAYDRTRNGSASFPYDVFVTKLNASGSAPVYSTYLGGDRNDIGHGIAVDNAGNAYVTGETQSADFPTTAGAYDRTFNSTSSGPDAFVTKFNASGGLVYSTYLGGSGNDAGLSIAVDSSRNAYVTGYTLGPGFPTTTGAFGQSFNGNVDAFVTKLNADGSAPMYSSYLGGDGRDVGNGIVVDSDGNALVTGETGIASSTKFPTTPGAYRPTFNGGNSDVFITKVNAAGSGLVYSTFVGGNGNDIGNSIAIDSAGNAYVTGVTNSNGANNFPTTAGAFDVTYHSYDDAFVSKLNASGTTLVYSTFLGDPSPATDKGKAIAVDALGNAYVTGYTASVGGTSHFPTTSGAFDTTYNGGDGDAFVTKFNASGSTPLYSTFLGSSGRDIGAGIALDAFGNAYITGFTDNGFTTTHFPTTPTAYDTSFNGSSDAFVVKIPATQFQNKIVLLLHGMNSTSGTWNKFINTFFGIGNCTLISNGALQSEQPNPNLYGVSCYKVNFGQFDNSGSNGLENAKQYGITTGLPLVGDFSTFAQLGTEVQEAVQTLHAKFPQAKIILVGHSRGGLAARAFLQNVGISTDKKSSVVALITTGTPHLGSPLGRVYAYLKSHPRSDPADAQDWDVVDFLKNKDKTCGGRPLPTHDRLDVRRPTINYLVSNGAEINTLNNGIVYLPKTAKYGQIRYSGVDLGILTRATTPLGDFFYSVFNAPCHELSSNAKKFILNGSTPGNYSGDGVVPMLSQRGGPSSAYNLLGSPGVTTLHDEETSRSADIRTMFCNMGFSKWLTVCS